MSKELNRELDVRCEGCSNPLFRDFTNRGMVTRCRDAECPVDEVDYTPPPVVEEVEDGTLEHTEAVTS